jgi:hypothetical protein
MNNFKCEKGHEFFVSCYRMVIKQGKSVYYYKNQNTIISCPHCKSVEISSIKSIVDYQTIQLGKYTMRSIKQRQEHLKKRSHEHFLKEIKDKKYEIDRDPSLQKLD